MTAPPVQKPTPLPPAPRGERGETAAIASPVSRSTLRTIERAIRNRWDIPEIAYKALPLEMLAIVTARYDSGEHKHTPRERIQAARVLALCHAQNQRTEEPPPATPAPQLVVNLTLDQRRQNLLARLDPPGDGA